MYKLTNVMIQNLEEYLGRFHSLFKNGRCEAWQLEELIYKSIVNDAASANQGQQVYWTGKGHDIHRDIEIIRRDGKSINLQIKSGKINEKRGIVEVSSHRTGRFEGNLREIKSFVNNSSYETLLVPADVYEDDSGKHFSYTIYYVDPSFFKVDNDKDFEEIKSSKGKISYITENHYGVKIKLVPSMSWQLWYTIPLDILNEKSKDLVI